MIDEAATRAGQRLLILAPTSKDAALTQAMLDRAGVACTCCDSLRDLCRQLDIGAAAVLLPEDAIAQDRERRLTSWLERQPPWSDLPVLVLTRPGADSAAVALAMDRLGNVTLLERPMRGATLISAARSAMRARQRQYQIRDQLAQRERDTEALRAADQRKDEFLAILAHELRNPLAPIRNSLHILATDGRRDPTVETVVAMMERQVNHMVRLVDDLLEISRITRGKIEIRRVRLDLADALNNAIEASRPLIDAGGHHLDVTLPPGPMPVDGDGVRLAQVFANLLNNAAKYTEPGGTLAVSAERVGDGLRVTVRDSGVGIPPELLPNVFDLFMQVDGSASRAQGGLGIGLTLVRSLAELHGGHVAASSAGAGAGSEFRVWLPLATGPIGAATLTATPTPARIARRILIVDDNRDAAVSLGMVLNLLGAETRVVHSGADALATLGGYRPQAVVLDIGMPGMDGYEVARRVRQQPEFAGVTLIALTGWGQEEDRRRAEQAGFDHHLVKPADVQMLEALLARL